MNALTGWGFRLQLRRIASRAIPGSLHPGHIDPLRVGDTEFHKLRIIVELRLDRLLAIGGVRFSGVLDVGKGEDISVEYRK